jgi:hypothetical protein
MLRAYNMSISLLDDDIFAIYHLPGLLKYPCAGAYD